MNNKALCFLLIQSIASPNPDKYCLIWFIYIDLC